MRSVQLPFPHQGILIAKRNIKKLQVQKSSILHHEMFFHVWQANICCVRKWLLILSTFFVNKVRKHFHYILTPFLEQFLSCLLLFPTDGLMDWWPDGLKSSASLILFVFFQVCKKSDVLLLYWMAQKLWRNCAVSVSICIDHSNLL